ncbi:MAG: NupC/NupG family nucleoside CNT transporter [Proteobacteria bacterium]|nr:NupC/NupG family nucleoside CNT transporter [Pseudomonadota bacterium]
MKVEPALRAAALPLLALLVLSLLLPALSARAEPAATAPAVPAAAQGDSVSTSAGGSGFLRRQGGRLRAPSGGPLARFRGLLGYAVVLGLCWLLSVNRRGIQWRPVLWGLALQALFALIVLNPLVGQLFFDAVDQGIRGLIGFAQAGIEFLFQSTDAHEIRHVDPRSGALIAETFLGRMSPALKSLAFGVLPTIIFFSALLSLLYHLGVMQWVVKGIARGMMHMLGTSGAETLSCTANIFLGQTEAPLLVRPFIAGLTQSELMAVMVGGFATVAGGVMAVYVGMLQALPGIAGHLMTASCMAAPAALAVSKLIYPETERPVTAGGAQVPVDRPDANMIEAVARGATDGMTLVLNIAAMLIAFVAMMALCNGVLGLFGTSLQQLLGWVLAPLAWTMGVPWAEAPAVGRLLGEKLVLTELLAYLDLKSMLDAPVPVLSARSAVIACYALCGFANVASIGVQLGGIGAMAPSRRADLARLGLRAMLAGALVSCLSAALAGILV